MKVVRRAVGQRPAFPQVSLLVLVSCTVYQSGQCSKSVWMLVLVEHEIAKAALRACSNSFEVAKHGTKSYKHCTRVYVYVRIHSVLCLFLCGVEAASQFM